MALTAPAEPTLDDLRHRVDRDLVEFLAEERASLANSADAAVELVDEILRLVRAGGKRLRPAFCYWGYRAAGGLPGPDFGRVAVALELLHTASLIHDDVMDGSRTRRGELASHVQLAKGTDDAGAHFGTSAAILVGDLAFGLGIRLLLRARMRRRYARVLRQFLTEQLLDMIVGQYLDLRSGWTRDDDEQRALRIATLKSGNYTVRMPIVLGASLAGALPPLIDTLGRYGGALGLAFQLQDDLLGAFGDPERTGKDADQDLREGKRTFLLVNALASPHRRELEDLVGRPSLTADEAERARTIIRASGAVERARERIMELRDDAKRAIGDLPEPARRALWQLADLVCDRKY